MPSHTHTHTHMHAYTHTYIHTCAERGQCFSDEKPVCLFHIPLVPGATSEGRESTQTFLQDADVRIKSQTDSCTQQGRKTERGRKEREREQRKTLLPGCTARKRSSIFLNILCVSKPIKASRSPSTNSPIFCTQRPYLIRRLVFPSTPVMLCVFTALRAIVAIVTYCSLAARLMGNHAPCCLHLVPCFSY